VIIWILRRWSDDIHSWKKSWFSPKMTSRDSQSSPKIAPRGILKAAWLLSRVSGPIRHGALMTALIEFD